MLHFKSASDHFFSAETMLSSSPTSKTWMRAPRGLIRALLHQRNEACRDLDRAQTDQVIIRGQLSNADTKVASKSF